MVSRKITTNKQGRSAKHKNHTVPKALLKRWLTEHGDDIGHWVLDCASGQIAFNVGSEATFAISEFRYVPVRTNGGQAPYRDEIVEDWFAQGENDLALITDRLLAAQPLPNRSDAVGGFIQAAILLGFRSAYEYEMLEKYLALTEPLLVADEISERVVDFFKIAYSHKLRQFSNWDYQVVPCPTERLLVCDRPMFDMTVRGPDHEMLVIPLGPTLMLLGTPPTDRSRNGPTFEVSDRTSAKIVALTNQFTVERARQFVVGTLDQLIAVQARFSAAEFQKRKATDKLVLEVIAPQVGENSGEH